MSDTIISTLIGIIGLVVGAFANHFLSKKRESAEIEKIRAETEKAKVETEKSRNEMRLNPSYSAYSNNNSQDQLEEVINRVAERVINLQQEHQNDPPGILFQPRKISERIVYIIKIKLDFEMKIRALVIAWGGEWAGSSVNDFSSFFSIAVGQKIIPENLVNEINDFYFFTQPLINSGEVDDLSFLQVQYQALSINNQLKNIYLTHLTENNLPLANNQELSSLFSKNI